MDKFNFPAALRLRHPSGVSPLKFTLALAVSLSLIVAALIGLANLTRSIWPDWQIKQPLTYPAGRIDGENSQCRSAFHALSYCRIIINHPGGVLKKHIIFLSDFGDYETRPVYDRNRPEHISDSLSLEKIYQRLALALVLWLLTLWVLYMLLKGAVRYWRLLPVARALNGERERWQLTRRPLPNPNGDQQKFPMEFHGRPLELWLSRRQRPLLEHDGQVLTMDSGNDYYVVLDEKLSVCAGLNGKERAELLAQLERRRAG